MDKSPDAQAKGETSKKPLATRGVKNGSPAQSPRRATNAPRPTTLRTPGAAPRASSTKSMGIKDVPATKSSTGRTVASSPKKSSVSTDGDMSSPMKNSSAKFSHGQGGDKLLLEKAASPNKSVERPQASAARLGQGGETSLPSPGNGSASKTEVKTQVRDKAQRPRPERTVPSKSSIASPDSSKPTKVSPVKRVQTLPSSPKPVNAATLSAKPVKTASAPAKPDSPSLTTKSTATASVKSLKSAPLQTKPTKSPSATVKPVNHASVLPAKSARATSAPVKPVNTASVPRQPEKTPLASVKSASVPTKPEKIPSTPVKPASAPSKTEKNQSPLAKPGNKVSLPSKPSHTGSKLNKPMKNAPVPAKQVTTTPVPVKPRNAMESPSKPVIGQSPLSISADKEERELVSQSPVKPVTHPDETVINKGEIKRPINEEEKISEAVSTCVAPVIWTEHQLVESVNESNDQSVNSSIESAEEVANTMIPPMEGELKEPSTNQAPVNQPMKEPLETSKMVVKLPLEAVKCAMKSHNSSSVEQPPIASPNTAIESVKDLQSKSAELIELQDETISCLHELTDKSSGNAEDGRRRHVEHSTNVMELAEPQVTPSVAAGNITEQVMLSAETVTALLEDEVHSVDQIKALDECLRFTVDCGNKFEEESTTSCIVEPTKLAGKSPQSAMEPVNNLEGFVTSPPETTSTETTGYLDEETTIRVDPFTYHEESGTGEIIQKVVSQLGGKLQFQVEEDIPFQVEPVNLPLMEGEGLLEDVVVFPTEQGSHSTDKALSLLGPMEPLSSEKGLQVVEKLNNLEEDVKPNGQSQILMEGIMSVEKTMGSEENDVILSGEDGETEHSLAESETSTEDGEPAVVKSENVVELEAVTFLVEGASAEELEKSRADIENRPETETELHLKEGVFSEEPDNSKAKLENEAEMESATSLGEDDKSVGGMEYKVEIEPGTSLEEDVSTVEPNKSTESLENVVEIEPLASLEHSASLGETDLCAVENTTETGPISAVDGASLTENNEVNREQMEPIVSLSASHVELEQVPFFEESVSSLDINPSVPSLKEGATPVEIKLDSSLEEGVNSLETELEIPCEAQSSTKSDKSIEETEHIVEMEPVTFAFQRINSPMEPEGSPAEAAYAFSEIGSTVLPRLQELKEPEKEQINTSELENKPAKLVTIPVLPEITGEPALETVEPLEEPVIHHAEQLLASVELTYSITDPVHSLREQKYMEFEPMNNVTEQITAPEEVEAEESAKEVTGHMDYPVNTLTSQGVSITPSVDSVAEEPMITLVEPSNYTDETQVESVHSLTSLVDTVSIGLTEPKYFPEMTDNRMDTSSSQGGRKSPMTDEHKNLPFDPVAVPSSETVTPAVEPTVSSTVPATTTIDISSASLGLSCSELEGSLQVMAPEPPSEGDNAQPGELKNVAKCLSMDPGVTTEQGVGEPWVLVQREELDDYKEEEIEEKLKRPVTLNQESEKEDDEEKEKGDEEGEAVASRCSTLSDPQLAGQSSSETSTPEELRTYEDSSSGVESHSDDVATSPPTTLTPDPDLGIHMGQEEGGETPAGTPAPKGKGTLNLLRDADNGGLSQGQAPAGVLDHSESGSEGYKRELPGINCSQDSSGARGQEQEEKAGAGSIQRGNE